MIRPLLLAEIYLKGQFKLCLIQQDHLADIFLSNIILLMFITPQKLGQKSWKASHAQSSDIICIEQVFLYAFVPAEIHWSFIWLFQLNRVYTIKIKWLKHFEITAKHFSQDPTNSLRKIPFFHCIHFLSKQISHLSVESWEFTWIWLPYS